MCLFQKAGKETRFFRKKPGFSLAQTANLPKLGLEEQSVKPQIKLSRGAENRLRQGIFVFSFSTVHFVITNNTNEQMTRICVEMNKKQQLPLWGKSQVVTAISQSRRALYAEKQTRFGNRGYKTGIAELW
ncbi:MAG: hypothetical protein DRJ03_16585 [Chloroflexi bacterium]|nr:MAG: hypothetical protein B6I35_00325 [Anaerolineaceae bacterium 4572_32.2]RLC77634.1 MAG: hypothetical protein DRI81_08275 [Chloroflexota bacterium]RLC83635.1 MAG: hypothetical protein DRJ03_16585 [Chloroflexota bacterium]